MQQIVIHYTETSYTLQVDATLQRALLRINATLTYSWGHEEGRMRGSESVDPQSRGSNVQSFSEFWKIYSPSTIW